MGLFDSIRNAVGGTDDGAGDDESTLLDSTTLDPTDFRKRAERVANADGLDFSTPSLAQLDTLVDALEDPETADEATAETTYTEQTVDFGCYLGEVLVRAYDGAWARKEGWGVTVAGPDDEVTVSVFEVAVRSLESDPVFAAVAEKLEADLALDDVETVEPDEAAGPAEPDETPEEADTEDPAATAHSSLPDADGDPASDEGRDPESGDLTVDAFQADESDGAGPDTAAHPDVERDVEDSGDSAPATADEPPSAPPDDEIASPKDASPEDASRTEPGDSDAERAVDADSTDEAPPASDDTPDASSDLIGEAEPDSEDVDTAATDETAGAAAEAPTETDDGRGETPPSPDSESNKADDAAEDRSGGDDVRGLEPESPPTADEPEPDPTADEPEPDPTAGDGLRAEYAETAQEFAAFWSEHDLDFSPDSLARLDALVDGEWETGRFRDATFGSEDDFDDRASTSIVTELGSYFGEVLLRDLDGEWTDETDHVAAVLVPTDSGPLAVPVFQVAMNSLQQTAVFERSYDALLADIGR